MRLSRDQIEIIRKQADMQLTFVQFSFSSYFKMNPLALEQARKFIASLQPGDSSIILQLLCPVPEEIHKLGTEPNLANGGASLEGMTEEERAQIKTVLAFDQLFREYFSEKITIFSCRDVCRKEDKDGRCAKCDAGEGRALAAMYLVMAQFVNDIDAEISYVSMAGTKSGVKNYIAPKLEKSGLFQHIFGSGYHLSLLVYPSLWCFGSYLSHVVNISACVEDLFSLFGKTDLLPFVYANPHLIMVRDVTAFTDSQVAEYALTSEICHKMGVD